MTHRDLERRPRNGPINKTYTSGEAFIRTSSDSWVACLDFALRGRRTAQPRDRTKANNNENTRRDRQAKTDDHKRKKPRAGATNRSEGAHQDEVERQTGGRSL